MEARQSWPRLFARLRSDPRHYQIAVLSSLLIYGVGWLDFDIAWVPMVVLLGTALLAQYACTQFVEIPSFDPRSPLISGLSLCLLLRTNAVLLAFLAAVVTITSKFVLTRRRKHIFNPTNFGIVAMMALTNQVWVSPAQWGSKLSFAFFIAAAGGIVIYRAARSDATYAFLLAYASVLFGRAQWLGDPWTIPMKQLQSGGLLLFAFYMISDPKTTPDSRRGRILLAVLVAAGTAYIQFGLYRANGLLWSLAICSIITPFIDRLLPGTKYQWNRLTSGRNVKGTVRETNRLVPGNTAYPIG